MYGGQPRKIIIVNIVLGTSGASLIISWWQGKQCLAVRFSFNKLYPLRAALFTNVEKSSSKSLKNYILCKLNKDWDFKRLLHEPLF